MREFAERLEWARRRAGFSSPREAAKAFGWNENTYKSREGGIRGIPDHDEVRRYARAFGVSFVWLLTGEGAKHQKNAVKIVGNIGAGGEISTAHEQEGDLEEIETVLPLPEGSIAFRISGSSMWPKYDPDDVVICLEQGSPIERVLGFYAAVLTSDGDRFLKRVIRGSAKDTFDLESLNADPIRGVKLQWVSEIIASFPASQWKKLDRIESRRIMKKAITRPRF